MEIGEPKTKEILELLELINEGKIRIPEFQRDFRWEINDICELIGSLLNGFPAGVLLLWNVANVKNKLPNRVIEGVDQNNVKPVELLILDGQQRLTSLYQLFYKDFVYLRGGKKRKFFLDLEKIKNGDYYESVKYFSALEIKRKNLISPKEQYDNSLLPFNILREEKKLRKWIRGYIFYQMAKESNSDPNRYAEMEDDFRSTFLDKDKPLFNLINYRFHVIELPAELSFEAVTTIFEKLNTTGQPLNIFEILTAKFFNEVNLRELWSETRDKLYLIDRFSKDEKDTTIAILILKAILLQKSLDEPKCEKLECKRKNLLEDLSPADIKKYWNIISEAFNEALSKLKGEFGCPSLEYLPYTTILVPFSLAINYIKKKMPIEDKNKAYRKLSRWYWASVFSGRYDSATDTKSKIDIQQLIDWFNDDNKKPVVLREFNIEMLALKEVRRGAVYIGVLNLLLRRGCKDFVTREPISTLIENNPKLIDSHHIFPRRFLKDRYGKDSEEFKNLGDIVLNKVLIRKDTNRNYIKGDEPKLYITRIKRESNSNIKEDLKEHLIPVNELMSGEFKKFIEKREQLIKNEISNLCLRET